MAIRKYWGFYNNGVYKVGCNGATIYVLDQNDSEICRFRDIPYAYDGEFQPGTNIFVAKSVQGYLAVYDLDQRALKHKITLTHQTSHDQGFAFSLDGKLFYDLDQFRPLRTRLVIYNTEDYSPESVLLSDNPTTFMTYIEFSAKTGLCYILGYDRDPVYNVGFIGILDGNTIKEKLQFSILNWFNITNYKSWEKSGFTEKVYSTIKNDHSNFKMNPMLTLENIHRGLVSVDSI